MAIQSAKMIVEAVRKLITDPVKEIGFDIFDVEFVKEDGEWYLKIYIDNEENGIFIDDCEKVSKLIDPMLDEEDLIEPSYYLIVSCPGADRPLRNAHDFERFMGEMVDVKLYQAVQIGKEKKKTFLAALTGFDENTKQVTVTFEDESTFCFPLEKAAFVRLAVII